MFVLTRRFSLALKVSDTKEKLYMGNSATSNIEGEGTVILKITSGKHLTLKECTFCA